MAIWPALPHNYYRNKNIYNTNRLINITQETLRAMKTISKQLDELTKKSNKPTEADSK